MWNWTQIAVGITLFTVLFVGVAAVFLSTPIEEIYSARHCGPAVPTAREECKIEAFNQYDGAYGKCLVECLEEATARCIAGGCYHRCGVSNDDIGKDSVKIIEQKCRSMPHDLLRNF